MHIPDGFLDAPTSLATAGVSVATLTYAVRRTGRELGERTVPLLGVTAAFVFAAQMLNFPVAAGTSGHFLGAAFAAVVMGPWAAAVVMTVVVVVQAVGMADGGMTALGANVLNMAVLATLTGYVVHRGLRALLPASSTWYLASVAAAAWASVMASAAATALEAGASGTIPLRYGLPAMLSVHAVIGLGEALITTTVLGTVLAARPDLVKSGPRPGRASQGETRVPGHAGGAVPAVGTTAAPARPPRGRSGGRPWLFVVVGLAVALVLAAFVSPFASQAPDGLERVALDGGVAGEAESSSWDLSPIPDYAFPGLSDSRAATAAAGLVGTVAMFLIVLAVGRAVGSPRRAAGTPDIAAAPGVHPMAGHEHTDHRHSGHTHRGHAHSRPLPEDGDPDHGHPQPHPHAHPHGPDGGRRVEADASTPPSDRGRSS